MSSESGFVSILVAPDGTVLQNSASFKTKGVSSTDAMLSRAEGRAIAAETQGTRFVDRVRVEKTKNDRRLRNAWVIVDGRVRVDLAKARSLRARQWVREASELRRFIKYELHPYARIMGQLDIADRLTAAHQQIDRVMQDLEARVMTMTESELASHIPDWPKLEVADER